MIDINKAVMPKPVKLYQKDEYAVLGTFGSGTFSFAASGEGDVFHSAKEKIWHIFSSFGIKKDDAKGDYEIKLFVDGDDKRFEEEGKKEGYIIEITDKKAEIIGYDNAGAFYGAITFSKLVHLEGDNILLPQCNISDYPYFEKRGHFMECRYGSDFMTFDEWKKAIDYFAEHKINTLNIALYGCWTRQYDGALAEYQYVPLKKYPTLSTPRDIKYYSAKEQCYKYEKNVLPTMYRDDYFGEMIAYAKKKNIEVFPLFNSLGHNTLIPRIIPETSAKEDDGTPTGVAFCTRNEKNT